MIRNLHHILGLIDSGFSNFRVLVIGDIMLDRYIFGDVNRISPEAPVPVLRSRRRTHVPGGAANVAMNLAGLGVQTSLAGFYAQDEDGLCLDALLRENGILLDSIVSNSARPTTSKTRVMSGQQQLLRLDVEHTSQPSAEELDLLLVRLDLDIPQANAIILSDYAKGVLSTAVCRHVIDSARRLGIPVFVDPKGRDFERYRGATTICPNLNELSVFTGVASSDLDDLLAAGHAAIAPLELDFLTVTMSERGIRVLGTELDIISPARAREVFDVSGAGDTVIATLAASTAAGLDIETALQLANIAAGVVVSKVGTVPITRADLIAQFSADIAVSSEEKVLDLPALVTRAAEWRAQGQKVVFTNGCFDLLHVGHITLLQDSKRMGDRLVVGINSDASVRCLKGETRPIVGENERARILAALASTDAIVVFNEDTPLEIIRSLKPDVLVKGGDYNESTVVGAPDVRSYGGRVEIVPTVAGFSTSNLVLKMSRK